MKTISVKSCPSGRLRLHILPILVWMGTIACVVVLFRYRAQRFEVLGLEKTQVHQIAATCTGRLRSVPVQLFEKVNIGQTLAVVDTVLENETLEAQLATLKAEIAHLRAQLTATQENMVAEAANMETDKVAAQRRYSVDVENARLRILELKAVLVSDQILLGDLNTELKIAQKLLEQDVIEPYELEKAEVQYNALAQKIEVNEGLLEQALQDFIKAQERRDEFTQRQPQQPPVDSVLEVIHKAVKVQEALMNELLARLKPLELKSPINGVVVPILGNVNEAALRRPSENVLRSPGEVITAGDPIFAVAEIEPSEIVAYINERQLGRVREGMVVELVKNSEPAQISRSQVVRLGANVELMPQQLWRNPNIVQWGQPILIKIPPALKLIPGELVGVRGF